MKPFPLPTPDPPMLIHATRPLFAWSRAGRLPAPADHPRRAVLACPTRPCSTACQQAAATAATTTPSRVLWGVVAAERPVPPRCLNDCLAELHRNPTLCRLLGIRTRRRHPQAAGTCRASSTSSGSEPHLRDLPRRLRPPGQAPRRGRARPGPAHRRRQHRPGRPAKKNADGRARGGRGRGCRSPPADARSTRTTTARSPRWTSGSATNCTCWWTSSTRWRWPTTSPTPSPATTRASRRWSSRPRPTCGEGRIETLAYDKAADDVKVHELLHEHGIKPVIQNRALWKDEQEKVLRRGAAAWSTTRPGRCSATTR